MYRIIELCFNSNLPFIFYGNRYDFSEIEDDVIDDERHEESDGSSLKDTERVNSMKRRRTSITQREEDKENHDTSEKEDHNEKEQEKKGTHR
jgi:hypothetical protein